MKNYVITIARGFGSGGKEIGMKLADRLKIPCYERQILTMASEFSGIDEGEFVEVDEKLRTNYFMQMLKRVQNTKLVLEPSDKRFVSDINLFHIQSKIIQELSHTQSCIIIGKCADYVLKDKDNVVSLYIEAPRKACVESIMRKMGVSEERAHYLIRRTDKYRSEYYKYYTGGGDWTNPTNYHLVLNSDKIGRDRCVDVIQQYVEYQFGFD